MEMVPPDILKIAREFLGLSQASVEAHAGVSRATIQRIERGVRDLRHYALLVQHFYEQNGIEFVPPSGGRGWGVFNNNTVDTPIRLNRLDPMVLQRPNQAASSLKEAEVRKRSPTKSNK